MKISLRKATIDDIEFIIETIIEAEKSNTSVISSCNIFSLTYDEYKEVLRNILTEDYKNYEYSISNFIIAEYGNEYVGALCSWIEGIDGTPSSVIKSSLLFDMVGREKIDQNQNKFKLVNQLTLERDKGTLQLEYGYVRKEYRRKGVFSTLIYNHILKNFNNNGESLKVQSILFRENLISFNALEKFGFVISKEKRSIDREIYEIFPYNIKVMMMLTVNQSLLIIHQNMISKYNLIKNSQIL